jgi:hypothetical protein
LWSIGCAVHCYSVLGSKEKATPARSQNRRVQRLHVRHHRWRQIPFTLAIWVAEQHLLYISYLALALLRYALSLAARATSFKRKPF